jgi:putative flippase GtrA
MNATKPKGDVRQFSTFLLVGGIAALANWGSRIGLSVAGLQLTVAIIVAYTIGMATAYVLSKLFVFEKSGRKVHDEAFRFVVVNIVAVVQVWLVTVGLQRWGLPAIDWTWHPEEVAHAIGVASPIITSYFGHQYFTFNKKADKSVSADVPETKAPQ